MSRRLVSAEKAAQTEMEEQQVDEELLLPHR